jgi:hypothetical protein
MHTLKRVPLGARVAAAAVGVLVLTIPIVGSTKVSAPRGRDVETRIQTLHSQLKITPEQEAAWNTVADTMRDNAKRMDDMRGQQAEQERTATAPDMIGAYAKTMDAHAEAVHQFASSFQPLYDSMSPAQKKTADNVFRERVREAAKRSKS